MNKDIILRNLQKEDMGALETMICETWHYEDLCSPKTAHKLAKVFLSSCLTIQTYTQVAVQHNTPVGVIMAKNIQTHSCPIIYRIRQACAILSLYLSREGREVSRIFTRVSDIDKQLLKDCRQPYKGELAFFAVSPAARKTGIGKALFSSMLNYMKSQNIENFYLFTDTSCNFGFYEHQGMHRRCEKMESFKIHDKMADMNFFLYDYCVKV